MASDAPDMRVIADEVGVEKVAQPKVIAVVGGGASHPWADRPCSPGRVRPVNGCAQSTLGRTESRSMTSVRTKVVASLIAMGRVLRAVVASAASAHSSTRIAPE